MYSFLLGTQVVSGGKNFIQIMEAELCSARTLSPSREESGDEELSVLPRHTKVVVTGNNRTKSVLVGLQGVVKKAVGLGGWHWLVLKNGVEVKLQRNALSVLEAPTGNEDDDNNIDCDNSFCSSSDVGYKDIAYCELSRLANYEQRVNLAKLGTPTLWRYGRHFNLVNISANPTKVQLIHVVQSHFHSQGSRERESVPENPKQEGSHHLPPLRFASRRPSHLPTLPSAWLGGRRSAMRIRKCANRLLGTTLPACSSCPLPAEPPRSWGTDVPAPAAAAALLCELNRSPWDDLTCLDLVAAYDQEEEADGGILGSGVKAEVGEARGIPGNRIKYESAAVAYHLEMERNGDVDPHAGKRCFSDSEARMNWSRKKETAKTRRKKKDDAVEARGGAAATETCSSCKKSDGKGWHCKRRAHHPHSLCNYHLAQLRSYSCSHGHGKASWSPKEVHVDVGRRKKKTEAAGADSSFYYYYSGFGPWRGKTRGGSSDNGDGCSHPAADEEEVETPMAGEDEEDSEDDDHDINGRDENDGREEGRRSYRRKGRKRMKARSLKSLL
ncbi:hypothetical protein MUK42_19998 [Musa troglodytarum]|uniref:WRC domain-containing protein n=1 Tax=Musa troglodytarum TaxID=320322 RepID=A0A9E7FZL2_9LILI|nr:hypothetical protein MUK42_19998 [Musa troglodytarum]